MRRRRSSPAPGVSRPHKSLGQHFLSDPRILDRIVAALAPTADETVIEIGPGRGALTSRLAERSGRLIAIELDRALAHALETEYAERANVRIVQADVLKQPLAALAEGPYVLIGNVPYYITTPILFHALEPPRPDRAVFLVQREVAERIVAPPGSEAYGALSVNVQAVASAELLFHVGAASFSPPPKVDSALVRVIPRSASLIPPASQRAFKRMVIGAFAQRRKQLKSIVRHLADVDTAVAIAIVERAGLDPHARPESLGVPEFVRLFAHVTASPDGSSRGKAG